MRASKPQHHAMGGLGGDGGGRVGTYDWTRDYSYADDSNRLEQTELTTSSGSITDTFAHDDRGSIVYLPGMKFSSTLNPNIETDFRDQIVKIDLATSGQTATYWQDGAGQRVRKVVVKGTLIEERRYIGPYEVWTSNTTISGSPSERTTLHVMDGTGRIAMRETLTMEGGSAVTPVETVRFQLGNHLGTASVEVDGSGNLISYEEYHPYGTTAWQAPELATVSLKWYRYTGMERDEESGLQRHGVRYYVVWLGRWASADPIGLGDGPNVYAYVHNHPIQNTDIIGTKDSAEKNWAMKNPAKAAQILTASQIEQEWRALVGEPPLTNLEVQEMDRIDTSINSLSERFSNRVIRPLNIPSPVSQTDAPKGRGSYEGAFKHALWQAMISVRFDESTALDVGAAHERDPSIIEGEDANANAVKHGIFTDLSEADSYVDLLNNELGRKIARISQNGDPLDLAMRIIDLAEKRGLWVVESTANGAYVVKRVKLSKDEADKSRNILNTLDSFAFTKGSEDEIKADIYFKMKIDSITYSGMAM